MPVAPRCGRLATWLGLCLLLASASCASAGERHYARLRQQMRRGDFAGALQRIEGEKDGLYGRKQELLYWLDRAVAQSAAGDFEASGTSFERAKEVGYALYTERVRDHAQSVVLGERALAYVAEPFEQVALHLLEADTYIARGRLDEARVELRAMQKTLQRLNEAAASTHSVYQDDAAGRWLSGLLHEADRRELGHLSEARIDLERALALYKEADAPYFETPLPAQLEQDVARLHAALGDGSEPTAPTVEDSGARLVVLLYDGQAPHKIEQAWETLVPPWQILKVAYPAFVRERRPPLAACVIDGHTGRQSRFFLASNFAAKARVHLQERMASIRKTATARAIARATAVGALQVAGAMQNSELGPLLELLSFGVNLATNAVEHADTRSWQTLPARLSVAVLPLEPGPIDAWVHVQGMGPVLHVEGQAQPGETLFRSMRIF